MMKKYWEELSWAVIEDENSNQWNLAVWRTAHPLRVKAYKATRIGLDYMIYFPICHLILSSCSIRSHQAKWPSSWSSFFPAFFKITECWCTMTKNDGVYGFQATIIIQNTEYARTNSTETKSFIIRNYLHDTVNMIKPSAGFIVKTLTKMWILTSQEEQWFDLLPVNLQYQNKKLTKRQ